MSLFSAVRGLWWVGSEVVDALKQLATFQPGRDDYQAHLAEVMEAGKQAGRDFADALAEKEAAEEVAEPIDWCSIRDIPKTEPRVVAVPIRDYEAEPQDDCGLGAAELNELYDDVAFAAAAFTSAEPQGDCGLGEADECLCRACEWGDLHDGEDCGTLVRFWIDGYHSDPITAFVDWDHGRFTITAAHPFARTIINVPIPRIGPLTVYSTDELEWVVDKVSADRTVYGPEYAVACKPRVDVLRRSLISDDYLCWLWLDAEKRHATGDSAAPSQRTERREALGPYTAPEVFAPPSVADEPAFTDWLASVDARLAAIQNHLTSAAPGAVSPPDAAPESPAPPVPEAGAGQPDLPWCAAEMRQVADILLNADSPFALGYANDLRSAADALGNDDPGSERVSWPWPEEIERRK